MTRVKTLLCLYVFFLPLCLTAQDLTNFTQFFINPYTFNPSYAGIEGRSAIFLAYRKQWANIEGAPTIANFSFHTPMVGGLNFGLNIANDQRGILNTSGMMLTLGYTVSLDHQKFIRFGLSGGAVWNGIDVEEIPDITDPALMNLLDKNFSLQGNAGISLHLKSFHLGASLPNIFSPSFVSPDAFTITDVKPFQYMLFHASNRFYFGNDRNIFEPYILYRMHFGPGPEETLPPQFEVAGVLHLNHAVWIGGSYKQDYGISALGGIKNNFFLVGASYSLKNTGINELNSPTYEIQLSYIFGPKKKNKPVYSFVNSEKEKLKPPVRKSASELLAEKRKQEELEKKKAAQQRPPDPEPEPVITEPPPVVTTPPVVTQPPPETREPVPTTPPVTRDPVVTTPPVTKEPAPQVTPPPVQPPLEAKPDERIHDGGPRFKNPSFGPALLTIEELEESHLARLEDHAHDPDEEHGGRLDDHEYYQRHEFVKRGAHREEMDIGHFVIVGVFKVRENAAKFEAGLDKMGFVADFGHLSENDLWYVYISHTDDIDLAKTNRDKYRKMKIFRDAWLLTVHH
jgi:type IX secretion system PorP/SprF family membrane protein